VDELIDKARVLIEALPWIRAFADRTVVIKYGGAAMVHGGGPQIGRVLEQLGRESSFVDGLRVTDDATMEVVEMVLGGSVNSEIVSLIGSEGGRAVGLTGRDSGLLTVERQLGPGGRDIGRVGRPVGVDPTLIRTLTREGLIPVIAPLGADRDGKGYNVNADTAAGVVAEALGAEKLILLTDVEGVLDGDGKLRRHMSIATAQRGISDGSIQGGMIPKVECCLHALQKGVSSAHIIDGRLPHALLLEIFTDGGVGTQIVREE
jgi:acetylglutamate kinase